MVYSSNKHSLNIQNVHSDLKSWEREAFSDNHDYQKPLHILVLGDWIGTRGVYSNSPWSDVKKRRLCTQRIPLCSEPTINRLSFLFLLSVEPGKEREMLSTAREAEARCYAASSMISLYCCGVRVFGQSGTLRAPWGVEAPRASVGPVLRTSLGWI